MSLLASVIDRVPAAHAYPQAEDLSREVRRLIPVNGDYPASVGFAGVQPVQREIEPDDGLVRRHSESKGDRRRAQQHLTGSAHAVLQVKQYSSKGF